MNVDTKASPIVAVLKSRMFHLLLFVVVVVAAVMFSVRGVSGQVDKNQAQFVADSVRRSAVQCYAIEGKFPETVGGVQYLENSYGLMIDHKRYVVYYESMGGNLIPTVRVVHVPQK
jgi:hypothetical protein